MKRIIALILFAICIGGVSYVLANPNPAPDGEKCVAFQNVKARIVTTGDGNAYVEFISNNEGTTMVTWEVRGWFGGRPKRLAGGKKPVDCCSPVQTTSFALQGCDDYELRIANCDRSTVY